MKSKSSKDGQLGEKHSSSATGHKRDATSWRQANQRCNTGTKEVRLFVYVRVYSSETVVHLWSLVRASMYYHNSPFTQATP